ncbi:ABC transporter ATP-binding protein [Actinacidiphila oryziradicis]|uniref:ABC transporter ATP-binding protein n=1 Tax=Actinacidiphila oryziradicis TaxID=2571141 RepID=A0A4U0S1B5_9ACTN|nr:ABC transporter ATP-binding protein [Actinacidiphila oryziradicis]
MNGRPAADHRGPVPTTHPETPESAVTEDIAVHTPDAAPAQAGDAAPVLSIDRVSHRFVRGDGESLTVLQDIAIEVARGEKVALVGPSGCGKTTLFRILSGLLQPTSGSVVVNSTPVTGPDQGLGFVFQNDRLLPWLSVRDNVGFGLRARGLSRRVTRATADEMIALVGLSGFEDNYPHQLSGGMRQRVNIARSLAIEPAVLLMDEPFAALDAQTREVMQEELVSIWERTGSTVLFITHQIDEAVFLADRVVVMRARPGRVATTLDIELDRPRPLAVKRSTAFAGYADRIWSEIEAEVRESNALEMRVT